METPSPLRHWHGIVPTRGIVGAPVQGLRLCQDAVHPSWEGKRKNLERLSRGGGGGVGCTRLWFEVISQDGWTDGISHCHDAVTSHPKGQGRAVRWIAASLTQSILGCRLEWRRSLVCPCVDLTWPSALPATNTTVPR